MARDVVGGCGGAGEDELPGLLAVVYRAPDVVPDRRHQLPLVDQPGSLAIENQCRFERSRLPRPGVNVEAHFARGVVLRGDGLAAGLGPFDHDSALPPQPFGELGINDARNVAHFKG